MTRLYADMLSRVTVFITVALFLGGCVAPNPQVTQVTAPTPQIIIQADIPGREVVQPIELDNCDGKADTKRTEHRTRSVESTISAEIAAKFGVSAEVLSAEVQATVGASAGWTEGQGTSIELVAPPGTRMAFQLVWIGNEQVGVVQNLRGSNIPIAFRIFKPTDVRIKSQYDIGCPITPTPVVLRPISTHTPEKMQQPTNTVRPTNTPMVSIPKNQWPSSPQEASTYFAKSKGQWEMNEYGGWNLVPQWPPVEVTVPLGVTLEGYNDGPNPPQTRRCMTVLGPAQVAIQGGTLWFPDYPENPVVTARKIFKEQTAWTVEQGGPTKCEAYGFQP